MHFEKFYHNLDWDSETLHLGSVLGAGQHGNRGPWALILANKEDFSRLVCYGKKFWPIFGSHCT